MGGLVMILLEAILWLFPVSSLRVSLGIQYNVKFTQTVPTTLHRDSVFSLGG